MKINQEKIQIIRRASIHAFETVPDSLINYLKYDCSEEFRSVVVDSSGDTISAKIYVSSLNEFLKQEEYEIADELKVLCQVAVKNGIDEIIL